MRAGFYINICYYLINIIVNLAQCVVDSPYQMKATLINNIDLH